MAASSPAERLESGGVAGWLAVECMDEVASAEHATWVNMSKSRIMGLPRGQLADTPGGMRRGETGVETTFFRVNALPISSVADTSQWVRV